MRKQNGLTCAICATSPQPTTATLSTLFWDIPSIQERDIKDRSWLLFVSNYMYFVHNTLPTAVSSGPTNHRLSSVIHRCSSASISNSVPSRKLRHIIIRPFQYRVYTADQMERSSTRRPEWGCPRDRFLPFLFDIRRTSCS